MTVTRFVVTCLAKAVRPVGGIKFGIFSKEHFGSTFSTRLIRYSTSKMTGINSSKGLVLGVYDGDAGSVEFTSVASKYSCVDALNSAIACSGLSDKKQKSRLFYGLPGDGDFNCVAVVKIGKMNAGYDDLEEIDQGRENVRLAVTSGVKQLQDAGFENIHVEPCGNAEAAAEAAYLSVYHYDELKSDKKKPVELKCFLSGCGSVSAMTEAWDRGRLLAEGQNLARLLMEAPANHMTPTIFSEVVKKRFADLENCQVIVRDRAWAESMKMGSFISVNNGSDEPLRFVEIHYNGGTADSPTVALVGKGITFDSGGISLKPPAAMDEMRADMGGAACVVSSVYTAARLRLKINLKAFVPLTENLPNGRATKPGDVVTAMNGKTIQVDNTDAEGRLVLCDALCYAQSFKPSAILDMATLTGAMVVALGSACTGVFSNDTQIWSLLKKASHKSGDRVWRMPLFKHYSNQMTDCVLADINNIGKAGREGGSCTAAAFLREFVTHEKWMHLDIAGVMNKSEEPYIGKGMSGRPTRTIVEFLNLYSHQKGE